MSNVKVAIRVRPLTEKEIKSEKNSLSVVNVVDENTVTVTNIKVSLSGAGDSRDRLRRYQADYVFDSSCPVTNNNYASQDKIYQTIGHQVITSILNGVSCCVMAYGQSATGKTYTMMGTDTNPGLIPRLCLAFAELQPLDIVVSYFEIYNERVHDLLASEILPCNSLPRRTGNTRKDLRVREHPIKGPYVQNLRRISVQDVETLLGIVSEGKRRRRSAATKKNSNSSRSHALLEISTPRATLGLVDLAGSEKACHEGYGGCRQKEGANINKSLVALSNVISALVTDGGRGKFVPYRNSALTWLLKDCFTGGASTYIIATISPSSSCYSETVSTLRWVARARHIPAKPYHSRDNVLTTKTAQTRYNQLLSELSKHHIRYIPETGQLSFDEKHWEDYINVNIKSSNIGNFLNFSFSKMSQPPEKSPPSPDMNDVKQITGTKVDKEMDSYFEKPLERTRSGSDFAIIAPMRHKKKYSSQEVLSANNARSLQISPNSTHNITQSLSEENIDEKRGISCIKLPVPILHDNSQRAEIVESVTERLYSKMKKNEEVITKPETTFEKRVLQPMSELKICTNARQRLVEISQKALRNKRKIGIPAYTQTKRVIIRMKDQGINVQNDLLCYRNNEISKTYSLCFRDAATETINIIPRHKEVACGSEYATVSMKNISTMTKSKVFKDSETMTPIVKSSENYTQTVNTVIQPQKKKRSKFYTYLKKIENRRSSNSIPAVVNINISPTYNQSSDSESTGDESHSQSSKKQVPEAKSRSFGATYNDIDLREKVNNQATGENEDNNTTNGNYRSPNILNSVDANSTFLQESDKEFETSSNSDFLYILSEPKIYKYKNNFEVETNRSWHDSDTIDSEESSLQFKSNFRGTYPLSNHNKRGTKAVFEEAKAKLYKEFLGLDKDIEETYSCSHKKSILFRNNYYGRRNTKHSKQHDLDNGSDTFANVERKIEYSCRRLESAVKKYETFMDKRNHLGGRPKLTSPTDYLHHLIDLRKDLVKSD